MEDLTRAQAAGQRAGAPGERGEIEDVRPALMPSADARVGGAASSGWQRRNETAAGRCGGDVGEMADASRSRPMC